MTELDPIAAGLDDTLGTDEPSYGPPAGTQRWDSSVMKCNTSAEQIHANIRSSIRRGLPQLQPHDDQDQVLALVGGGWSLNDTVDKLREVMAGGAKAVALNGSAAWLMGRGIRPSLHIVMDARPSNARFVESSVPGCKYLLASQCHPDVFDACKGRDVRIFHVIPEGGHEERRVLDFHYGQNRWKPVPTAGTVGMVALIVLRILGFRWLHLFGIDSCCAPDGRHHAYQQPENDTDGLGDFWFAGRRFLCTAWQASQVQNFKDMMGAPWNDINIEVHGDGVLAHLVETAVRRAEREQVA